MSFHFAVKQVRHEEALSDKTTNIKAGPRWLINEKLKTGFFI